VDAHSSQSTALMELIETAQTWLANRRRPQGDLLLHNYLQLVTPFHNMCTYMFPLHIRTLRCVHDVWELLSCDASVTYKQCHRGGDAIN
jgi:hypothetical protein